MGLPPGVHSYAILPIGYPMGRFGPVGRGALADIVYQDHWGQPYRPVAKESVMPRIAPVTGKADVAPEYQHVVDDVLKVFGSVRGPFSIMLHSPKLAERMLRLVTFNREESVVRGQAALTRDPGHGARAGGGVCVGGTGWRGPSRRGARGGDRPDPREGRSGDAAGGGTRHCGVRAAACADQSRGPGGVRCAEGSLRGAVAGGADGGGELFRRCCRAWSMRSRCRQRRTATNCRGRSCSADRIHLSLRGAQRRSKLGPVEHSGAGLPRRCAPNKKLRSLVSVMPTKARHPRLYDDHGVRRGCRAFARHDEYLPVSVRAVTAARPV